MESFQDRVYKIVTKCPRGRVISYGGVAAMLGKPRHARAVGAALRELPDGSNVPWWRVINSSGAISIRGTHADLLQRSLLEREEVEFSRAGRVDWDEFGWEGL